MDNDVDTSKDGIRSNIDCIGAWSEWSECEKDCDNGSPVLSYKTYNIIQEQRGDGAECITYDGDTKSKECNLEPCPNDCIGEWGGWSECDNVCGEAKRIRKYTVKKKGNNGGKECPYSNGDIEEKKCDVKVCKETCNLSDTPINCTGVWGGWGVCSKPCDGGEQEREYNILNYSMNGGEQCLMNDDEWNRNWWEDPTKPLKDNEIYRMEDNIKLSGNINEELRDHYRLYNSHNISNNVFVITLNEAEELCKGYDNCGGFTIDKENRMNYQRPPYPSNPIEEYKHVTFIPRNNINDREMNLRMKSYIKKEGVFNVSTPSGKPDEIDNTSVSLDGIIQRRKCNLQKCPEDCIEGWNVSNECLPTKESNKDAISNEYCGTGTKIKRWEIKKQAKYGGKECIGHDGNGVKKKYEECELPKKCSKDCKMGIKWDEECKTTYSRCSGVQQDLWIDIEPVKNGGRCPTGDYKPCNKSNECDEYILENGEKVNQKCYEMIGKNEPETNRIGERECSNTIEPNRGCNNVEYNSNTGSFNKVGVCHIEVPEINYRKCNLNDVQKESNDKFIWPLMEYNNTTGTMENYESCNEIPDKELCNQSNGECKWKWDDGKCIEERLKCRNYNTIEECNDNYCEYDNVNNVCKDIECHRIDQLYGKCEENSKCIRDSNNKCREKEYGCVNDKDIVRHRHEYNYYCEEDDTEWINILGKKCVDIGNDLECDTEIIEKKYDKYGKSIMDACPLSCNVNWC
tara:strand:+ start:105 stop:2327 length:2223 start_codon:yes stop_codon:yes gene_type:complete